MCSMRAVLIQLYAVIVILLFRSTDAVSLKESCSTCREITDNFNKEIDRTARKNFGGGNTAWEERKLSKYETSEIRLVEILEGVCESSSFECNRMVEEHEEHFETWWFKRKTTYPDLYKWFCIDTIKVCCPRGTFGPDCNACVGGSERPCYGNGACDGDGTRAGHGRCTCHYGYQGEFCLDCIDGYFNEEQNDTHSLCTECHTSCKTCTGSTNKDCQVCKAGWEKDQEGACSDVDECLAEPSPCKEHQYCENTDGSHHCKACDKVCSGCRGLGPDQCLTCADGYRDEEGTCTDVDECKLPDQVCPGEHRECINIKGSYKCFCSSGYEEEDGQCVETKPTEEDQEEEETHSEPSEPHEAEHQEAREDL